MGIKEHPAVTCIYVVKKPSSADTHYSSTSGGCTPRKDIRTHTHIRYVSSGYDESLAPRKNSP